MPGEVCDYVQSSDETWQWHISLSWRVRTPERHLRSVSHNNIYTESLKSDSVFLFSRMGYTEEYNNNTMIRFLKDNSLYIGLVISLSGLLGSLYFSEIMGLAPCLLCWYQRIALYPLVAIFAVGIAKRDNQAWSYAGPLIVAGGLLAAYHVAMVQGLISEPLVSCSLGVSCAQITWNLFGFITIPFLSLLAFLFLGGLWGLSKKS